MDDIRFTKNEKLKVFQKLRISDMHCHSIEIFAPFGSVELDFHEVKKLYWWLDSWIDEERARCQNCHHERDGCQYHDGD